METGPLYCYSESDEYNSDGNLLYARKKYSGKCKPVTKVIQKNNLLNLQLGRINAFKAQDADKGNFDITFDLSGKLLYAHKYIFTAVSTPMEAMISERWSNKDDIIKIETYTYEEFFQFLTFLYCGICEITEDNVSRLIDVAEFFDVAVMKNHCDTVLSKTLPEIAVETYEEVWEMAQRYSLSKSIGVFKKLIYGKMHKIVKTDGFIAFKQPFIDFLLSAERTDEDEQELFLSVVKWAEHQVSTKEPTLKGTDFDENFNLQAVIKKELSEILPTINFQYTKLDFVKEFVVEKAFLFSSKKLYEILAQCQRSDEEKYFKAIYELAEKEALEEQNTSIDENFNLQNVIERKLNEINAVVDFKQMKFEFVKKFVVDKAFLFYSKELYEIIAECQRTDEEEGELFEMLYELAKKNVENRNLPGEMVDLPYAIKTELAEYLPKIKFHKMDKKFLIDFAAETGFISREQAISCFYVRVEINYGDITLIGSFEDLIKIQNCVRGGVQRFDSGWTLDVASRSEKKLLIFHELKFSVPKSPSTVQRMRGIEWYLLLEKDGILAVKHQSLIKRGEYLIAELLVKEEFFILKENNRLTVSHNTIF